MPRTARVAPKDHAYHVLTRGNNRQDVFEDEEDFRKYIDLLLRYKEKYHFKLYHYVMMTNHVHLVIEPSEGGGDLSEIMKGINLAYALYYKEKYHFKLYHYVMMTNHVHLVIEPSEGGGDLSEIMKGINLAYALYYKRRYNHTGHFWQDRYKSIIISKDDYLLACGSYVELNPVRARMVEDPKDYRWSSYQTYAYGKRDVLVDEHPIYLQLSEDEVERRTKYRQFVRGMLKEKEAMKGEMDIRI